MNPVHWKSIYATLRVRHSGSLLLYTSRMLKHFIIVHSLFLIRQPIFTLCSARNTNGQKSILLLLGERSPSDYRLVQYNPWSLLRTICEIKNLYPTQKLDCSYHEKWEDHLVAIEEFHHHSKGVDRIRPALTILCYSVKQRKYGGKNQEGIQLQFSISHYIKQMLETLYLGYPNIPA